MWVPTCVPPPGWSGTGTWENILWACYTANNQIWLCSQLTPQRLSSVGLKRRCLAQDLNPILDFLLFSSSFPAVLLLFPPVLILLWCCLMAPNRDNVSDLSWMKDRFHDCCTAIAESPHEGLLRILTHIKGSGNERGGERIPNCSVFNSPLSPLHPNGGAMRYAQVAIIAAPLRNVDLLFNLSLRRVFQPGHLQSGEIPGPAWSQIVIFCLVFVCRATVL